MTVLGPNLASRPFANERPVRRVTLLVWMLALLLLAVNVFLYQRHLRGQHEQRQVLATLQGNIAAEESAVRELEDRLSTLDLEQQNELVRFLNAEIAKRTFSWSRLFDQLEEVLPAKVEVRRVSPRVAQEKRRGSSRSDATSGLVSIEITGHSPSSEELLLLIDNLFTHPGFAAPNLRSESQRDDRRLDFSLSVLYLPEAAGPMQDPVPSPVEETAP